MQSAFERILGVRVNNLNIDIMMAPPMNTKYAGAGVNTKIIAQTAKTTATCDKSETSSFLLANLFLMRPNILISYNFNELVMVL